MASKPSSNLSGINDRLNRIESLQCEQQRSIGELIGRVDSLLDGISEVKCSVGALSNSTDKSGLLQKGLLGAIVVQALLSGVATPDMAKQLIQQLFQQTGGG